MAAILSLRPKQNSHQFADHVNIVCNGNTWIRKLESNTLAGLAAGSGVIFFVYVWCDKCGAVEMPSHHYGNFLYKEKMISRPSYFL